MATTLTECQTLVASIAALVARRTYEQARVARQTTLEYYATVVADAGTAPINQVDSAAAIQTVTVNNQTALTPSIAVARANASSTYLDRILAQVSRSLADQLDDLVTGSYASWTLNAPAGAAGVAVTETVAGQVVSTVAGQCPIGDPIAMVLGPGSTHHGALRQHTSLIDVAKGGPAALANILNGQPTKFRGATLINSSKVRVVGSAPATIYGLCFSKSSVGLVTVAQTLTNDESNVQAMSTYGDVGVFVGLAFDGSDNQVVTFRSRAGLKINNAAWGVQVKG